MSLKKWLILSIVPVAVGLVPLPEARHSAEAFFRKSLQAMRQSI